MSEAIEELVGRVKVLLRQAHADRSKAAGYRHLADGRDESADRAEKCAEEYQQILGRLGEQRVSIATEAIDASMWALQLSSGPSSIRHEPQRHEVTLNVTGNLEPQSIARQIERIMSIHGRTKIT